MKIGILTFQSSNNYGAILQAYALQYTLESLNTDVEIINYVSPSKIGWYKATDFDLKKGFKHNIKQVLKLSNSYVVKKKNELTGIFKIDHLNISRDKFVGNSRELASYLNKFDVVSVGSDQVWNYQNTSSDMVYLLDFHNTTYKKVSYAASIGMYELPDEIAIKYKNLLSQFDAISVREPSAHELMEKQLNLSSEVVLDPTLLLDNNEWSTLCIDQNFNVPYILIYSIGNDKRLSELAKTLKKKYNYKIVKIVNHVKDYLSPGDKQIVGVSEFLTLIKNAKIIITNSFHGVAFSINFQKDFLVCLNSKNSANTRITSLLDMVNLGDKIVKNIDLNKLNNLNIDYEISNQLLDEQRNISKRFIQELIVK